MKISRFISMILAAVMILSALTVPALASADESEGSSLKRNVVYVYDISEEEISRIDVRGLKITHINYAFIYVEADAFGNLGYVTTDKDRTDLFNFNYYISTQVKFKLKALTALKEQYPWLSICVSVGGGDDEQCARFAELAADEAAMQRFAVNLHRFLSDFGLDGVDLDWEAPAKSKELDAYAQMASMIRAEIGPDATLSAAIPCDYEFTKILKGNRAKELDAALSYWNLMTYDLGIESNYEFMAPMDYLIYEDPETYERTGVGWSGVRECIERIKASAKLSNDKLVLGLPYYGGLDENIISTTEISWGQEVLGESSKPYYRDIAPYLEDPTWTRYWNDLAQCPYLLQKDADGNITGWLAYDDPESLAVKLKFAQELGLSGVMCWTLNGDDDKNTLATEVAKYISDEALSGTPGAVLPYVEGASPTAPVTPVATDAPDGTADDAEPTRVPDSQRTADAPSDGGSPVIPIVIGVCAVVAIGAVAAVLVVKKKK